MSRKKCMGDLCCTDRDLIHFFRLHILRRFKSIPVFSSQNAICKLYGSAVFIYVCNPEHEIRIRTVTGNKKMSHCISGHSQRLCENICSKQLIQDKIPKQREESLFPDCSVSPASLSAPWHPSADRELLLYGKEWSLPRNPG